MLIPELAPTPPHLNFHRSQAFHTNSEILIRLAQKRAIREGGVFIIVPERDSPGLSANRKLARTGLWEVKLGSERMVAYPEN
jgi:hypothetical protein